MTFCLLPRTPVCKSTSRPLPLYLLSFASPILPDAHHVVLSMRPTEVPLRTHGLELHDINAPDCAYPVLNTPWLSIYTRVLFRVASL